MRRAPFVSAFTVVAFLSAGIARPASAGPQASPLQPPMTSSLRTSMGLAGTYFLVKELKKTTDEASKAAQ